MEEAWPGDWSKLALAPDPCSGHADHAGGSRWFGRLTSLTAWGSSSSTSTCFDNCHVPWIPACWLTSVLGRTFLNRSANCKNCRIWIHCSGTIKVHNPQTNDIIIDATVIGSDISSGIISMSGAWKLELSQAKFRSILLQLHVQVQSLAVRETSFHRVS